MKRLFINVSLVQKLAILVFILVIASCKRDDDPFADNQYLLSATRVLTTTATSINTMLAFVSMSEPDIALLAGFVEHDVEVWRVTSYFAYIAHAYRTYNRFTASYGEIFNEPYASRIPNLFNGLRSIGEINGELTTDVGALLRSEFREGFATEAAYADVRQALDENSIAAWSTSVPLLLVHGASDTQVPPDGTVEFYNAMRDAGTVPSVITMILIPGADHGDGLVPASVESLLFLISLTGKR